VPLIPRARLIPNLKMPATIIDPCVAIMMGGSLLAALYREDIVNCYAALKAQDFQKATGHAARAAQLQPHRCEAYVLLSDVSFALRDTAKYERYARLAFQLAPRDFDAVMCAIVATTENDTSDARSILDYAVSLESTPWTSASNKGKIRLTYSFYLLAHRDTAGAQKQEEAARAILPAGKLPEVVLAYRELMAGNYGPPSWGLYNAVLNLGYCGPCFIPAEYLWDGRPLNGKTILVVCSGGLGDVVQFARYLPAVKAAGGRVIAAMAEPLAPLFSEWDAIDEIVPLPGASISVSLAAKRVLYRSTSSDEGRPTPDASTFDFAVQLAKLPIIFDTRPDSIPPPFSPHIPPDRMERARQLIGEDGFKIGLCWAASQSERSFPAELFAPLADIPGVRLFSFQRNGAAHCGAASRNAQDQLKHLTFPVTSVEDAPDMLDTAARIAAMDLVISADTFVAHLAGGITPTFVVLPTPCDWRWRSEGETSAWYPLVRLFRQPAPGDWAGAVQAACKGAGETV